MSPESSPTSGDMTVMINATYFIPGDLYQCEFGGVSSSAQVEFHLFQSQITFRGYQIRPLVALFRMLLLQTK